jgi:two-component system, LytTR family, sensor kinase
MPAPPRLGWRFVLTATFVVTCLLTLASLGGPGAASPALVVHRHQAISWATWLLLAPAIVAAARRVPFGEGTPMRWLWRHLALGAAFSPARAALAAGIHALVGVGEARGAGGAALVPTLAGGLLLYALIAVSYQAIAYHRSAREREAVAARLRADLAESRLANLEGQLHPHFLFNALNSIAALMRVDPRQAETMLEQLSELLRATLRTNPMHEVPLDEALHLAEQYLAIERVRFQDRLRATVEASGAARRGRVPQLILQPLVENAVRHGIAPLESGGSVRVTAVVNDGTLLMTVEDDGVGFGGAPAERAGSGLGLRSVRALLSHLYGAEQRFDVRPRSPSGTTVTIALPYRPVAA